ncbi:N5-carboxyaminoimidazole ribonucleotide mutase [bioreactor metagenome]|uniref:N5-carboxyaminoimidazole ribonucleotide mutase n=1 Tax=bioreactor metagenome TaxID=1076179 RepID=A0A645DMA7_9ZZZZ
MKKVWLIMGSDSDLSHMSSAAKTLEEFGVPYEMTIASAHRCTDFVTEKAKGLIERDFGVVIAAAGMSAHLPGVIAGSTPLPVIGVPLASGPLQGADALHSIVQMPTGVPVATVAINGTKNAALLAVQILSLTNAELATRFAGYKSELAKEVLKKNDHLQKVGYTAYLQEKGMVIK